MMRKAERFPELLIIGGMKCGTTTLYFDLLSANQIFFPTEKEPGNLGDPFVLSPEGYRKYAALYSSAQPEQICCDASTMYTMRPKIEGVAKRAKMLLGERTKLIYLVRNPLERSISHFNHLRILHGFNGTFEEALFYYPEIITLSKYFYQVSPWLESFGGTNLKVIKFEHFVRNRDLVVREIFEWLGIDCDGLRYTADKSYNVSSQLREFRGLAGSFGRSTFYRATVRKLLSAKSREWLRNAILPISRVEPVRPSAAELTALISMLGGDSERLAACLGWTYPVEGWSIDG